MSYTHKLVNYVFSILNCNFSKLYCIKFLCGSNHNIEDASIVSLFEVYNIDYSICLLKDMPRGYYAIRENVESDWIVKK